MTSDPDSGSAAARNDGGRDVRGTGAAAGDAEARLVADGVAFDAADATLLRAIAAEGSVSGAASTLGRSRARALGRLEALEEAFGSLVERRRGGADGGGSRLTATGRATLARFDRLRAALAGTAAAEESVVPGEVVAVEGELGRVETDAGTLRALLTDEVEPGDAVQVAVRADAVTLHAPDEAPAGGGTSARNRFAGRVASLDVGDAVARVAVDVAGGTTLAALVTVESVERLALAPGTDVVATFKATATRASRTLDEGTDEAATGDDPT
jgi:molybdate transport system regulatory protein